jgi:2-amino-4-hydroxy-6-hydroxymethyldihydropteridine diphosphokinase
VGRPAYQPAYVGAGSNLGEPAAQLRRAFTALEALPQTRLVARSALYLNPPMGPQEQPDFVNAVAALLTRLPPGELLEALQAVEQANGRRRDGARWGPRTLDLDLLLYGRLAIESPTLQLPHPGLRERVFVLRPLSELAPWLQLPDGTPVAGLAAAAGDGGLVRVAG